MALGGPYPLATQGWQRGPQESPMKMPVVSETCAQPGKQDGGIRVLRTEDRVLGGDQLAKGLEILFWG